MGHEREVLKGGYKMKLENTKSFMSPLAYK